MHHTRDGFFFERRPDGSVLLRHEHRKLDGSLQGEWETLLSAAEWATAVASVSGRGETGLTHAEALATHLAKAPTFQPRLD